ncbi:phytanoyl-CoA dioxygenase-like protein [Macroventuria anomochaeta]|uniref:Phytanoyl-CoA dioxygenase-like protein n=1 Tax=Macroventuria anomochaeta TaxID=301207 RepID=A0ACB6RWF7_9PLEO|nr:phytanoyl-CoA dioxygenase-like protein [Macroventuria anomochaeta]KAF2626345.1 phytanoyl-CoA dioxygenase-like protein [Macroventuria anomochaeta]
MGITAKGTSVPNAAANSHTSTPPIEPRVFSTSKPPSLDDFKILTTESVPIHYPLAKDIVNNIPIYDLSAFSSYTADQLSALQDEWYHILLQGPGVFATKHIYTNLSLIDHVNDVYSSIIKQEAQQSGKKGDHFATSGSNSRIWNSFSKHCLADPTTFIEYYSNPWLPLIFSAWLGPHHRLTAQVNIVRPGSAAQISHRDYHIGFQSAESCEKFPKALQVASQFLTLQGAVAHSDMPLESGPTRLLPFSQKFEEGYIAYRLKEFQDYFLDKHVSVPLKKGDGLFFNPALFHAAGSNTSADVQRSANLLQISSAFGKPMEMVDSLPLVERTWEALADKYEKESLNDEVRAFVSNVAEGYPFPTNLDRRVPETAGMAPDSEQDLLLRGLKGRWDKDRVLVELKQMRDNSRA